MTQEKHIGHHGHSGETFIREWSDRDTFNSFNNWKGLLYSAHYERIAQRKTLLPPIEARIDLTLRCNLNCAWCNSAVYRKYDHELGVNFVYRLVDFLTTWGVKSVCWAGGGEPTQHPQFNKILEYAAKKGLAAGILSNGTSRKQSIHETIGKFARWVGISVDAGCAKTYKKLKGANLFLQVLNNLSVMVENSEKCNVGYKFLISPANQHEIFYACERAKDIGVRDFIVRPMDTMHQGMIEHRTNVSEFDAEAIFAQFGECHKLATDDFHVFTVMHKFNSDFSHSKPFSQCYGAPLKIHIAPNADVYFCDDQFYKPDYCLGSCAKDPFHILNLWGKEKHRQLLYGDTPKKCKTRCCVGDYNIQCEKLFVNTDDPMCWEFP